MSHLKKTILAFGLLTFNSFAATPEQVEQYLTVSNSEEELISLESQFSAMQKNIQQIDSNATKSKTYDMQMLSLRFKDYLEKNISEDEMTEILENYKNVVLLQFVSASSEAETADPAAIKSYLSTLEKSEESKARMNIVEKISKEFYSKEGIMVLFNDLMKPLIEKGIGGHKIDKKILKKMQESYIKMMTEASQGITLYASKDFTIAELNELLKVAQTPAMDHEVKAVFGAMAYALKEYFMSLANRYDVKKHQSNDTQVPKKIK